MMRYAKQIFKIDPEWLELIKEAKAQGLTIEEIKRILESNNK